MNSKEKWSEEPVGEPVAKKTQQKPDEVKLSAKEAGAVLHLSEMNTFVLDRLFLEKTATIEEWKALVKASGL